MMDRRRIGEVAVSVCAVGALYGGMQLVGITCPIKFVTGISCVGCGMTRAWLSLILHQDLAEAWYYHPLFWLVIPAFLLICFKKKIEVKYYRILLGIIISIAVGVYIYRMFSPEDLIVVFEPKEGLIGRLIRWGYHVIIQRS